MDISWSEGTQNQAFGMQASNATVQNDSSYQCYMPGGWMNGNGNIYGSLTQTTQQSSYHTKHYSGHNRQSANGNYWNDKATDLNSVQNSNEFSTRRNISGQYERASQLVLRNQTLMNRLDNCNDPSGPYTPKSHHGTYHNPLKVNAPQTVMPYRTSPQMAGTSRGGNPFAQVSQFSRVASGAPSTGTQGRGIPTVDQKIKILENLLKGNSVSTSSSFYSAVERNPNHNYSSTQQSQDWQPQSQQATAAVTGQIWGNGTVTKNQGKAMNGSNDQDTTSMEKVLMDRGNLNSASFPSVGQRANFSYLEALIKRDQRPAVGSSAHTAGPLSGQGSSWSAGLSVLTDTAKGTGVGHGAVSVVPERTNNSHLRSSALMGPLCSNANLPYYKVNGNKNGSHHSGLRSGSGHSLPMQNTMERPPPSYFQSVDGNLYANSSCPEKQTYHLSSTGQQLLGAESPVRSSVQEAQCHTQGSGGKYPGFILPKTSNMGVAVATGQVDPTQTSKPPPNQFPLLNAESQNGHSHALGRGYNCASTFPNQVKQPYRPLVDNQHVGDPPPYPKTQRYVVTVTEERPGTGFTAKNVIFMADNHKTALNEQVPPREKTAVGSGVTIGELSGSSDPKNLSTAITRAESVFMPKPTNQQKCINSSGQRAVAVVPPISQQSSNSLDEGSGIINTNEGLPFKIKNVWSLTEEEYAAQEKIAVSVPHDPGSDANLKPNILATSATSAQIGSSPAELVASFQKTAQAPDLASPSICPTNDLAVSENDIHTSTPADLPPKPSEVAHQNEERSALCLNVNDSETLPSLDAIESVDQSGESKKNNFDLYSCPMFEWTIEKLRKLIAVISWKQQSLPQVEMDIDKLQSIYGNYNYQDLSCVFDSDLYISIMNEVSSVTTQNERTICYQIRRQFQQEVIENCHILAHDATYSNNVVYKSSWLNLNEQLDDIDKENGFPLHLRFRRHIPKCGEKEMSESEDSSPAGAPIELEAEKGSMAPVLTEVELAATCKDVNHSKDTLSSIENNVLPPDEVNQFENGNLAEDLLEQEAEKGSIPPVPTQTESPVSEEEIGDFNDPLSSIEIRLLSGEDARRFFNEITDETEDRKREAPTPHPEKEGRLLEAKLPEPPVTEKEKTPMEIFCCLKRWLCVLSGYGHKSVCSCPTEDGSNLVKTKPGASTNDSVAPAANSLRGGRSSTAVGTAPSPHDMGTADLRGEKPVKGASECTVTEQGLVDQPEEGSLHCREVRNLQPHLGQRAEMEMDARTSSEPLGVDNRADLETPPFSESGSSDVLEIEIEDIYSSYSEVCKIASAMSAQLRGQDKSKDRPLANVDGNGTSCRSTGTGNMSLQCNEAVVKSGTSGQQVRSPAGKGLKQMHVHKPLTSKENHNHKDDGMTKKARKRRKRKWEIANPKSSACDRSASDLEKTSKKHCPASNATVVEYKSRINLPEKCEGDDHSETLRPKVPRKAISAFRRNVPANNDEREKIPGKAKVLLVLSKAPEEGSSVSLALFGSSPQKRNGSLHSHKWMDSKSSKIFSVGRIPPPPTTISLKVPSEKTNPFQHSPPVISRAKQQVFARWKSSLVLAEDDHPAKRRKSKRHARNGGKISCFTPTRHPKHSKAPLSQPVVTPLKLKAVIAGLKQAKSKSSFKHKFADNKPSSKPADHIPSENNSAKRVTTKKIQNNLADGPFLKLNKIKVEAENPKRVERRRSTVPDTQIKRKHELGNPGNLSPLQKEHTILEFKLLPESFNFKEAQDHKESVKLTEAKKTESGKTGSRPPESLKTAWKLRDSWSRSSEGKKLTSSEIRSPGVSTQTGAAFQEYKKKYIAKGKI